MNKQNTQSGFTLIEMMVSVALFATVISVALPTMIVVVKASARAQALQTTIDNTSFAIDAMSRQVRLGRNYRCTNDSINTTQWNAPNNPYAEPLDCVNGASTLIFTDQYGKRQAYRYNSASSTLENWNTDAGTWVQLTAPKVLVKNASFTVTGSSIYDGTPPIAEFSLLGAARNEVGVPEFTLSTSMTQYVSERSFVTRRLQQGDASASGITYTSNTEFGTSIAVAGDIDGDAVRDLVVGMPGYGANLGGAQILRMQRNGIPSAVTSLTSNVNGMPTFVAGERVGAGAAAMGDLDGDSMLEVMLGAPGTGAGAMYLMTLQSNGTAASTTRFTSGVGGMPVLAGSDQFGTSIAGFGGRQIAVGAPGDDTACANCGAVHIITFTQNRTIDEISKIETGLGLIAGDSFGSSVAFLGYDTLGQRILAVGAPGTACISGVTQCGAVYIIHLDNSNGVASYVKLTSGTVGMPPLTISARFGSSIAAAGGLDGDTISDLLVGAEETNGVGSAYLLFMNADASVKDYRRITNAQNGGPALDTGDRFGRALVNMGDLNGDARRDFAIGAPGDDGAGSLTNAGALYILFGN